MVTFLKLILFSILINWCISVQMLNQSLPPGRQKYAAIVLALVFAVGAGILVLC